MDGLGILERRFMEVEMDKVYRHTDSESKVNIVISGFPVSESLAAQLKQDMAGFNGEALVIICNKMEACEFSASESLQMELKQAIKKKGGTNKGFLLKIMTYVLSVLSQVLSTEEIEIDPEKHRQERKTIFIVSGIILAANYGAITSLPNILEITEAVRRAILIPAALSLISTLFLIVEPIAFPNLNCTRAKKLLLVFSVLCTACSYSSYVAMKLGASSKVTVIVAMFVGGLCILAATMQFLFSVVFPVDTVTNENPPTDSTWMNIL